MATVFTNLVYHIVFSTKKRLPLIAAEAKPPLYAYMGGVIRQERGRSLEIGGVEDHVHLLVVLPPSRSVSEVVGRIKGSSSRWIELQPWYEGGFAWQRGFAAFSVSESRVGTVQRYIRTQQEHHARSSFDDELRSMLHKHRILSPNEDGFDE